MFLCIRFEVQEVVSAFMAKSVAERVLYLVLFVGNFYSAVHESDEITKRVKSC
jgi:hypothetical protein